METKLHAAILDLLGCSGFNKFYKNVILMRKGTLMLTDFNSSLCWGLYDYCSQTASSSSSQFLSGLACGLQTKVLSLLGTYDSYSSRLIGLRQTLCMHLCLGFEAFTCQLVCTRLDGKAALCKLKAFWPTEVWQYNLAISFAIAVIISLSRKHVLYLIGPAWILVREDVPKRSCLKMAARFVPRSPGFPREIYLWWGCCSTCETRNSIKICTRQSRNEINLVPLDNGAYERICQILTGAVRMPSVLPRELRTTPLPTDLRSAVHAEMWQSNGARQKSGVAPSRWFAVDS